MLNERQQRILDLTAKKQRISVRALAKALYVSEMTIRRDLAKMEQEGYLLRYHGGAMANREDMQYPIDVRMRFHEKEKRDLAKQAERYIENGQTIFLPASSTCAHLIPCLRNYENLLVITNSVQFMLALSRMGIRCILVGGEYSEQNKMLVGRSSERFLRTLSANISFLACDGISDDGTVTVEDENTAEIVRIAFENSEKRIILSDHTKLGRKYTYNICHRDEADDILIT